jgi:hypothetical protein
MAGYAVWSLEQREETVIARTRTEMEAYATALSLAFDSPEAGDAPPP